MSRFENIGKGPEVLYLPSRCSGFWPTERTIVDRNAMIEVVDERDVKLLRRLVERGQFKEVEEE